MKIHLKSIRQLNPKSMTNDAKTRKSVTKNNENSANHNRGLEIVSQKKDFQSLVQTSKSVVEDERIVKIDDFKLMYQKKVIIVSDSEINSQEEQQYHQTLDGSEADQLDTVLDLDLTLPTIKENLM